MAIEVDLYSDTVTKPTAEMRRFMCEAEVGDEQKHEEPTANLGGGSVWPLEKIRAVVDVARRRGLSTHMDGARLMNAVVASGISAQQWAAPFDSAWIDFTKGLGAPVGAAIAGSREFIAEAWRCKQQMGGAMRQAGIIAAGGVCALRHHVKRLAEDHAN